MPERNNRSLQKVPEQPRSLFTVELGQEFHIPRFYAYTKDCKAVLNPRTWKWYHQFDAYDPNTQTFTIHNLTGWPYADINLRMSDRLIIPLMFSFAHSDDRKSDSITPFHPDNGYVIDSRDYDVQARVQKQTEAFYSDHSDPSNYDFTLDPFYICVKAHDGNFTTNNSRVLVVPSDWLPLLEGLRMLVLFPDGSCFEGKEGKGLVPQKPRETYGIDKFYPADLGPFPTENYYPAFMQGLRLHVPARLQLLQEISYKFLLEGIKEPEIQSQETVPQELPVFTGGLVRSKRNR